MNNDECWSDYCSNSRCACAPDREPIDNGTNCRMNLLIKFCLKFYIDCFFRRKKIG